MFFLTQPIDISLANQRAFTSASNFSQRATMLSTANRFTLTSDSWANAFLIASSLINLSRASANLSVSAGGTSMPVLPSSTISAGPVSQSKLTIGSPAAIASMSTSGNPSYRDDIAIMDACRYCAFISLVAGIISTLSPIPSSEICLSSRRRWLPDPTIRSCQPLRRSEVFAHASSIISKPFCPASRPTASTRFSVNGDGSMSFMVMGLGIQTALVAPKSLL